MDRGNRVRVVNKDSPDFGREGIVLGPTNNGYVVQLDGEPLPQFYFARQLEKIEEETT